MDLTHIELIDYSFHFKFYLDYIYFSVSFNSILFKCIKFRNHQSQLNELID